MSKSALVNIAKGVAVGMVAGAVVGYAGKSVKRTANDVADTAKYMFK